MKHRRYDTLDFREIPGVIYQKHFLALKIVPKSFNYKLVTKQKTMLSATAKNKQKNPQTKHTTVFCTNNQKFKQFEPNQHFVT